MEKLMEGPILQTSSEKDKTLTEDDNQGRFKQLQPTNNTEIKSEVIEGKG